MKIVIDTNVFISGLFFGGYPREVLDRLINDKFSAYASREIISEYYEIIDRFLARGKDPFNASVLKLLAQKFNVIEVGSNISVCRDPDDDKFINCAIYADALYIVSGDRDLLDPEQIQNVKIVTARDFIENYMQYKSNPAGRPDGIAFCLFIRRF